MRAAAWLVTLSALTAHAQAVGAAAPVAAPTEVLTVRLHVGGQVGLPHILGLTAMGSALLDGKPRLDLDLLWEPSLQLQSYSVGLAWRPWGVLALGPRLRLLQFEPPWSRSAKSSNQAFFGLGLEGGARIPLGASRRALLTVGLQGTYVPAQAHDLQWLVGLNVGLVYGLADWKL